LAAACAVVMVASRLGGKSRARFGTVGKIAFVDVTLTTKLREEEQTTGAARGPACILVCKQIAHSKKPPSPPRLRFTTPEYEMNSDGCRGWVSGRFVLRQSQRHGVTRELHPVPRQDRLREPTHPHFRLKTVSPSFRTVASPAPRSKALLHPQGRAIRAKPFKHFQPPFQSPSATMAAVARPTLLSTYSLPNSTSLVAATERILQEKTEAQNANRAYKSKLESANAWISKLEDAYNQVRSCAKVVAKRLSAFSSPPFSAVNTERPCAHPTVCCR